MFLGLVFLKGTTGGGGGGRSIRQVERRNVPPRLDVHLLCA